MRKFGGHLFGLSLVLLQFCFLAIGAQATDYAITLTASASSIYIPSTQTITFTATIAPAAQTNLLVNINDSTGNLLTTFSITEGATEGWGSTGTTGTLSSNTTDEVYANIGGGDDNSDPIAIQLLVNAPTIRFLALTLDSGNSTTATASIAVPTSFAITINPSISPADLTIGLLNITEGSTSATATATAGSVGSATVVTVTPSYQYDVGTVTVNGEPVNITIEP
jgi:hypothetical protein